MADTAEFVGETEPFRRELLAHCYRMLGSVFDAEDLVQETYLRAWRHYDGFENRSSVRTWLYQIATNGCLTALAKREQAGRRVLPSGLHGPEQDPANSVFEPDLQVPWLQPIPNAMVTPESSDPASVVAAREGVRLALVASLQHLPSRQRAVLVLRDVLAFTAQETAEILEASVPSVNSALQRARALLSSRRPDPSAIADPEDAGQRDLLRRYVTAFEAHDIEGLKAVLRADAVASMPPFAWRLSGGAAIAVAVGASEYCAGARLLPCRMNGGWGLGQYRPADGDVLRPFALVAVEMSGGQISRLVTFLGSEPRFPEFGLPDAIGRGPLDGGA